VTAVSRGEAAALPCAPGPPAASPHGAASHPLPGMLPTSPRSGPPASAQNSPGIAQRAASRAPLRSSAAAQQPLSAHTAPTPKMLSFSHTWAWGRTSSQLARVPQNPRLQGLQAGGSPCIAPQCPPLTGAAGRALGNRRTWKYTRGAALSAGFVFLRTFSSPETPGDFNIHADSLEITMFDNRKLKGN